MSMKTPSENQAYRSTVLHESVNMTNRPSTIGIAAMVCGVIVWLPTVLTWVWPTVLWSLMKLSMDAVLWLRLAMVCLSLVGIVLGGIGSVQKRLNKTWALVGLMLNLTFFGYVVVSVGRTLARVL